MLNEPRAIRGTEFCLSGISLEKGLYHARSPLLILMPFVSQPAWVFDRFLDSFPNQPSLSSIIEGGCKPVIKTTYINLCVVHI